MNVPGGALRSSPALPAGFAIERVDEIDSTNSELMRRARAGRTAPVVLVARAQTAGRGRLGRGWAARPGASLTFSLGLPFTPGDWSGLSLAVGVAVAGSLHPRIHLKWPNDLWVDDRKLAGILIETAGDGQGGAAPRHVVVGIGVNIAAPAPEGLSTPPAALQELLPGITADDALARILPAVAQALATFEAHGYAPFQALFGALDALAGREVTLSDGSRGTARGTSPTGGLLVHTSAGLLTVTSAEVSVRPAA